MMAMNLDEEEGWIFSFVEMTATSTLVEGLVLHFKYDPATNRIDQISSTPPVDVIEQHNRHLSVGALGFRKRYRTERWSQLHGKLLRPNRSQA
jgi:hypothetical protein